jgi:hypothetical protein
MLIQIKKLIPKLSIEGGKYKMVTTQQNNKISNNKITNDNK